MRKVGRNDPCSCGSGKKYKSCCAGKISEQVSGQSAENISIALLFQRALDHHHAGRLSEAETIYQQIIGLAPGHADSLHLLGVIAFQRGNFNLSVDLIKSAIAASPKQPIYYCNLGNALQAGSQISEAVVCYQQALLLKPDYAEVLNSLGNAKQALQHFTEAAECYRRALWIRPTYAEANNNLGNVLRALGQFDEAVISYRKAISLRGNYPEAFNNLGNALREQGHLDDAINSYRKAIALNTHYVEPYVNLGNVFQTQGLFDEAATNYQTALSLKSGQAEVLISLGNAQLAQGKLDEAISNYSSALAIKPESAPAYNNLGSAFQAQGLFELAEQNYRQAIAINSDFADAYSNLGHALHALGRLGEAVENYREAIRLDSKFEGAQHLIAAFTGVTTDSPPQKYIENLFDGYSDKFDSHLVQKLGYKVPEELVALLGASVSLPTKEWCVLDLGCGTGLSGKVISPHARQLVGVDLSSKMIEKAAARGIYQRLVHADLLSMMRQETPASFDLIMAADVMIYVGRLDEVIAEARRILRPGGFVLFSVEELAISATDDEGAQTRTDYRLNPSGRYSHSSNYLNNLASSFGFKVMNSKSTVARFENRSPVSALILAWEVE